MWTLPPQLQQKGNETASAEIPQKDYQPAAHVLPTSWRSMKTVKRSPALRCWIGQQGKKKPGGKRGLLGLVSLRTLV